MPSNKTLRRDHHPLAAIVERDQCQQMFAGFCVPKKRAAIVTRRREQSTVRSEIDRFDTGRVTGQRAQLASTLQRPRS